MFESSDIQNMLHCLYQIDKGEDGLAFSEGVRGQKLTLPPARTKSASPADTITAVFQTKVTNRNGNVTRYQFNQLGNVLNMVPPPQTRAKGHPLWTPCPLALALTLRALSDEGKGK
jgi:hypothetical protein